MQGIRGSVWETQKLRGTKRKGQGARSGDTRIRSFARRVLAWRCGVRWYGDERESAAEKSLGEERWAGGRQDHFHGLREWFSLRSR